MNYLKIMVKLLSVLLSVILAGCPFTEKEVYRFHRNSENKIALTFDDGPHSKYTEEILDILSEYDVKATFFIVGENADTNPEIVRREIREGHEIGNHTYSHKHISDDKLSMLKNQIVKCENAIYEATDLFPKLFRPPEGRIDLKIEKVAEDLDYTVILWNIDTRDWEHTDADKISKEILNNVKPGDIILMHDFISGKSHTAEALKTVIPELLSRGYKFVTVSQLLCSQ